MVQNKENNWAENIFSFSNKHLKNLSLKEFLTNNVEPLLIIDLKNNKNEKILKQKSREGKTIIDYALQFGFESFLIEVIEKFPQCCAEELLDSENRNVVYRAAIRGLNNVVIFVKNSQDENIRKLLMLKDKYGFSACDYINRKVNKKSPTNINYDNYRYSSRNRKTGFVMGMDDPSDYER